jgi:cyclopropane fatty-acyl-phospholipid synthase-like methyltransferase
VRFGAGRAWVGDEWGTPAGWRQTFTELFRPADVAAWRHAVELGPRSGKYTIPVLEASGAAVRAYDVSPAFLDSCARRCREWITTGYLTLRHLPGVRADELLQDLRHAGWTDRRVDAVYSIDAMVHVDLQYLIAYLLTATLVLDPTGSSS